MTDPILPLGPSRVDGPRNEIYPLLGRARTALSTLGVTQRETDVDLNGALKLKEDAYIGACQAEENMQQQLAGLRTHKLRLEGAMTQLLELGAVPTGRLSQNPSHPGLAKAEPRGEPEPAPAEEPAP